ILALPLLIRILLMPLLVGIADLLPNLRVASTLYSFLTAALFVVPVIYPNFWTILIFTGAALMFWSAVGPFTDATILHGTREHGVAYARVRLWGSVGFMMGSLVAAAA